MSEPTTNNEGFELDKDQIDALRLETESVSPTERKNIIAKIKETHGNLLKTIGKFIKKPLTDDGAANRFVITDNSDEFSSHWLGHFIAKTTYGGGEKGYLQTFQKDKGNFVVGNFPNLWNQVNNKEESIEKYGGEKEAQEMLKKQIITLFSGHELTHLYQATDIPLWLKECAAYYYSDKNMENMAIAPLGNAAWENPANFYEDLLKTHGEEIPEMVFGNKENRTLEAKVETEFKNRQSEIFPEYKTEVNYKEIYRMMGIPID